MGFFFSVLTGFCIVSQAIQLQNIHEMSFVPYSVTNPSFQLGYVSFLILIQFYRGIFYMSYLLTVNPHPYNGNFLSTFYRLAFSGRSDIDWIVQYIVLVYNNFLSIMFLSFICVLPFMNIQSCFVAEQHSIVWH